MTLSLLASTDADEIKDVANYGCAGGVNGFIYYTEINEFFDAYEEQILRTAWTWLVLHTKICLMLIAFNHSSVVLSGLQSKTTADGTQRA
jgi:hypothetical protein